MNRQEGFNRFQFNHDTSIYHQIHSTLAYPVALIRKFNDRLTNKSNSTQTQFIAQGFFVHGFNIPGAQRTMNF